jgi:hypothetical protein
MTGTAEPRAIFEIVQNCASPRLPAGTNNAVGVGFRWRRSSSSRWDHFYGAQRRLGHPFYVLMAVNGIDLVLVAFDAHVR